MRPPRSSRYRDPMASRSERNGIETATWCTDPPGPDPGARRGARSARHIPVPSRPAAALAGAVAGALTLGLTESMAGATTGVPSLVGAVGDRVVNWLPRPVTRFGIETFGTHDKAVLVGVILALCGLAAAALGVAASRRFRLAVGGFSAFGVIGVFAALRAPGASPGIVVAATVAAVAAGLATLVGLLRWAPRTSLPPEAPQPAAPIGVPDRRRFLAAAGGVAAGAATLAWSGRWLSNSGAASYRGRYALPPVPNPVPPPPESASVALPRMTPVVVPNDRFYTIDTRLLGPPAVDADRWRLRVSGLVDHPYELTFAELLAMPMVEEYVTLCCVSNEVGGDLVGNAAWRGVRLADILQRAGVRRDATQVVGRSVDGFTTGFPTEVALDGREALVAVGMNGELLPRGHGFPARLVVPGLYGYVSATKWLTQIELTTWDAFDAYWVPRGWSKRGPVKTQSRIDTVAPNPPVAGLLAVGGVAWAPTRGISRVELRVDDGPWQEAQLATSLGNDSWRQWVYRWEATPGPHRLAVRATDGRGETQTGQLSRPEPDGATGYHTIRIEVAERRRAP